MKYFFILLYYLTSLTANVDIRIESKPSSAHITIDSKAYGVTPLENISLSPGFYQIDVSLENYVPVKYDFELQSAGSSLLRFHLNKLHTVVIKTEETGLKFELDKKFPWEDQQMEFKMEEGIHTLKVFKGDSLIDEIELEVIQPLEYFFEFSKIVE